MPFDNPGFVESDVQQVLKAAKVRIGKPELWCKNMLFSGHRACALGAIIDAMNITNIRVADEAVAKLEKHIPRENSISFGGCSLWGNIALIPDYNNAPTTTHEDIMAWFDRAIESCA